MEDSKSRDKRDTPLSPEELSGIAGGTYEQRDGTKEDDTISGGEGADSFALDRASGSDVVTDFNPDEDTFQFMGGSEADEFEVQVDGDGNTIISFGDTTITVQGVELTHDRVAELAGFSAAEPFPPGR